MFLVHIRTQARRLGTLCLLSMIAVSQRVEAQVYNGGGPLQGANATNGLVGIPHSANPRSVIITILQTVLSFMSLIAVATVIIAGIYLVVGLGSDDSKDKAKKIIQYTLIGLIIILLSQVIVNLVTSFLANQISGQPPL
jgi:type IV secretory pathway VirB2 component (pilin)